MFFASILIHGCLLDLQDRTNVTFLRFLFNWPIWLSDGCLLFRNYTSQSIQYTVLWFVMIAFVASQICVCGSSGFEVSRRPTPLLKESVETLKRRAQSSRERESPRWRRWRTHPLFPLHLTEGHIGRSQCSCYKERPVMFHSLVHVCVQWSHTETYREATDSCMDLKCVCACACVCIALLEMLTWKAGVGECWGEWILSMEPPQPFSSDIKCDDLHRFSISPQTVACSGSPIFPLSFIFFLLLSCRSTSNRSSFSDSHSLFYLAEPLDNATTLPILQMHWMGSSGSKCDVPAPLPCY